MKILYKTPEITVEDLAKADVLCASAPTLDKDNFVGSYGGASGVGSGQGFDFDTGNLLLP